MFDKLKKSIIYKITGIPPLEFLLENGLVVGENFKMLNGCIIDDSHCHRIKIGNDVTLAPRVHILAHDASPINFIGICKEGDVIIGNNVFVGANSTILCNTRIGNNVIIGANSLVNKDIPDNSVVAGNPAKIICSTEEYLDNIKNNIENKIDSGLTYLIKKDYKYDLNSTFYKDKICNNY